jgi:DNA-binding NtrC family response regulator
MFTQTLPRLLVIDDLFGRTHPAHVNADRASLCGQYLLEDVTGDQSSKLPRMRVKKPIAQVTFSRGQIPRCSVIGDTVENDLEGTLEFVRQGWEVQAGTPPWSMVLLDLCFYTGLVTRESDAAASGMPEGRSGDDDPSSYFGLQLLSSLTVNFPELPIVILSSQPREEVSREFAARGALAFLPRAEETGPTLLREYLDRYGLIGDDKGEIIGYSKPLLLALRAARQAGAGRRNVLIRGERGTGKELIARYIHRHAPSGEPGPYLVVDSGTLNPQLYASELFGHRRGAFTGADRDREGKIIQANGGDLFLDEIGNMPPDVQIGLLRVLEQREVAPLGAQHGQTVDVRFLSATNEEIEGKAEAGAFRADLLDRLREGGTISIPPLRSRLEDLPLLIESLVRQSERSKPGILKRAIEQETFEYLAHYSWPGNVRELRNAIYGAVTRFADVEHLFPIHFRLEPEATAGGEIQPQNTTDVRSSKSEPAFIRELLMLSERMESDVPDAHALVGSLPDVQRSIARILASLLRSALIATKRPTPDNPQGEILIHPAVKLLLGDRKISASYAADVVKRVINFFPETRDMLLGDPLLREAFQVATRLRPGRQGPLRKP